MKNEKLKILLSIILLGSLLFPLISLADGTYKMDGKPVNYKGFVPCGKDKETLAPGESDEVALPCQLCHFFVMFRNALDFILKLAVVIAVLMLTIGGFLFLFAGGSPKILDSAKRILTSTLLGLVIILAAWMIINTIFMAVGAADWTGLKEGWFSIECPIKPFIEKEEAYQKEEKIEKIVTKVETNPDEVTVEDLVFVEENIEELNEEQLIAIKEYSEQVTDSTKKDAATKALAKKEEKEEKAEEKEEKAEEKEEKNTITAVIRNSRTGKSCNEYCNDSYKHLDPNATCISVGTDAGATNGQKWIITLYQACGKQRTTCGEIMTSKWSKYCADDYSSTWRGPSYRRTPWTNCLCQISR